MNSKNINHTIKKTLVIVICVASIVGNVFAFHSFRDFNKKEYQSKKRLYTEISEITERLENSLNVLANNQKSTHDVETIINNISIDFIRLSSVLKSSTLITNGYEANFKKIASVFTTEVTFDMPLDEYKIYKDSQISDKERAFIKNLIKYIDQLLDGVYVNNNYDIYILNQNIELIDRHLWQDYKI